MKKTRITALLLLSLSLILVLSFGVAAAPAWKTLTTVEGSTSQTTDYIYVPSGEWRISWSYTVGQYPNAALFSYTLNDAEGRQLDFIMQYGEEKTSGTTYVHEDGPGNYYFDITENALDSYGIKIEYQQETHVTAQPTNTNQPDSDGPFSPLLLAVVVAAVIAVAVIAIVIVKKRGSHVPPPP